MLDTDDKMVVEMGVKRVEQLDARTDFAVKFSEKLSTWERCYQKCLADYCSK